MLKTKNWLMRQHRVQYDGEIYVQNKTSRRRLVISTALREGSSRSRDAVARSTARCARVLFASSRNFPAILNASGVLVGITKPPMMLEWLDRRDPSVWKHAVTI